jgi:hypothetical protein
MQIQNYSQLPGFLAYLRHWKGHLREYILSMDELRQVDKREQESQEVAVWFFGISIALMAISLFASVR